MKTNNELAAISPQPWLAGNGPTWFRAVSIAGDVGHLSGQVPFDATGQLLATGRLGAEVDLETGYRCARQCGVNLLAALSRELDGLERVERLIKLTVFVASTPRFHAQPEVANGASEVLTEVLGERGRHSRSAIGVAALPLGSPVEVELIALLRGR